MAKDIYFKQCKLTRENQFQVSWIPEKYAKKDKIIKLKDGNGNWENGWKVEVAGTHRMLEENLPDSYDQIKQHRKSTGDSMKKV